MRLFLALCRSRTVGEAARTLGVNTSTVSRRLTQLEEQLGTTLFTRGREGIGKTLFAENLLASAEAIEVGVAELSNQVDRLEREVAGEVRITCPADVADVAVAPVLSALLSRHSNLGVALEPSEALMNLTRREADIALRIVRPSGAELIMKTVASVRWVAVGSTATVKAIGTLRRWHDAPWIGWGSRYAGTPAARWLAEHATGVTPVLTSNSLGSQISAAKAAVACCWFRLHRPPITA